MNTTNVFVELLVIGLGPLTVIAVLFVAFDPEALSSLLGLASSSPLVAVIPLLGATYVLGIVADRIADTVFGLGFSTRLRRLYFPTDEDYHTARRVVMLYGGAMHRVRQYGRSRMRIARGWSVNLPLLAIPVNFAAVRASGLSTVVLIDLILVSVWLGTIYSWYSITRSEYRKIREGAAFIRGELERGTLLAQEEEG